MSYSIRAKSSVLFVFVVTVISYMFYPDYISASTKAGKILVNNSTKGYYNRSIGTLLDGTSPAFPLPYSSSRLDPTISFIKAPDLANANNILGDWFHPDKGLNNFWTGPQDIPAIWIMNTETAIIYEIDAKNGYKKLRGNFDVDNGVFVWVNGEYKFGAVGAGDISVDGTFEYRDIDLGSLHSGKNYIQVLREDNGINSGYNVKITGVGR